MEVLSAINPGVVQQATSDPASHHNVSASGLILWNNSSAQAIHDKQIYGSYCPPAQHQAQIPDL
jgi:hypothetical protein